MEGEEEGEDWKTGDLYLYYDISMDPPCWTVCMLPDDESDREGAMRVGCSARRRLVRSEVAASGTAPP